MRVTHCAATVFVAIAISLVPRSALARPGTHFLLELDGGATFTGDGGATTSLAFGGGGKLKGIPLRFYLLGRVGVSEYQTSAVRFHASLPESEDGGFTDLSLGPRVYLPIVGPLRLFLDGALGGTSASGTYSEPGLAPLSAEQWLALAQLSAGLQWRLLYHLSLGARFEIAWNSAGLTGVERLAGAHDPYRISLKGGLTWHF